MVQEDLEEAKVRCPKCGKTVDRLIGGTCEVCFLEREGLVRLPKLHITLCRSCLSYRASGAWRPGGKDLSETVKRAVEEQLRGRVKVVEPARLLDVRVGRPTVSSKMATVDVAVEIGGLEGAGEGREIPLRPNISLERVLCRVCQLKRSDYFSCIVQLRAEGRPLEEEEAKWATDLVLRRAGMAGPNSMDYLSKILDRKEGRDFYLGSASLGRLLAREIISERGGALQESKSLTGVEKGSTRQLYKFTLLVRLPRLRPGDITFHEGIFYTVLRQGGSRATIVDGEGKNISLNRAKANLPLVARREEVQDALVLEIRPDGIQILDPRSNTTFDMEDKPPGAKVGGTIKVFWSEGILRHVPEIGEEA